MNDLGVNLQNMGWYVAGTYTMMVVGKIITGYLADIVGRRVMWIVVGSADGRVSAGADLRRDAGERARICCSCSDCSTARPTPSTPPT